MTTPGKIGGIRTNFGASLNTRPLQRLLDPRVKADTWRWSQDDIRTKPCVVFKDRKLWNKGLAVNLANVIPNLDALLDDTKSAYADVVTNTIPLVHSPCCDLGSSPMISGVDDRVRTQTGLPAEDRLHLPLRYSPRRNSD